MAGAWGCPHDIDDFCSRVNNLPCNPGMKGCVLYGRYIFSNEEKQAPVRHKKTRNDEENSSAGTNPNIETPDV